ncbi:MAG: protein kinase [Planctomycetaceae bacterium]|nr:protein kinase [Planctomycetaceae bacterium]
MTTSGTGDNREEEGSKTPTPEKLLSDPRASAGSQSQNLDTGNKATAGNAADATIIQPQHAAEPEPAGLQQGRKAIENIPEIVGSEPSDTTVIGVSAGAGIEDYFETLAEETEALNSGLNRAPVVGDYQLVSEIGRGAMGVVYKARHRKLNRLVALKMVLAGQNASPDALRRFVAEARAVAKLQHPSIVQIYDIGEHRGLPFMALELIDGTDLQKDLKGLPRDARRAAELVEELCRAMHYAHDHQVLHRDLKPANILVDLQGKAKISDFGLARTIEGETSGQTTEGTVMGSPSYMPPEQALGKVALVSPRSDQYSLGAVLYQLLTARAPFVGSTAVETVQQVVQNEPVAPSVLQPGVPPDIETICLKALQKSPDSRYGSCLEMAADLRRFINGEPIHARPVSRLEKLLRWCRRNPSVAIPSALSGLLTIAILIVVTFAYFQASAQADVLSDERDKLRVQEQIARNGQKAAQVAEEKAKQQATEADRQRIIAEEAQKKSDENAKLATKQAILSLETIQFILTEVDRRLDAMPGTQQLRISLLEVLEKKWEEIDQQMAGGIEGEAVPTLFAIRSRIALIWSSLDRVADADKQFKIIADQAEPRLLLKNRNDASRFNVAQNFSNWSAVRSRVTGNPADSESLREKSLTLLKEILAEPKPAPKSPLPFQVNSAINRVLSLSASANIKMGQRPRAKEQFEEIERTANEVLGEIDAGADWFRTIPPSMQPLIRRAFLQDQDLARSGLAGLKIRDGKADEGLADIESVIARNRAALAEAPDDRLIIENVAQHLRAYSQALLRLGRFQQAVAPLEEAVTLSEKNVEADPLSAVFRKSLANSQYSLSQTKDLAGDSEAALRLAERARLRREELVKLSPDVSNQTSLMLCSARTGNSEATLKLVDQLLPFAPKYPELSIDIARALSQISRYQEENARPAILGKAMDSIEQAIKDGMRDPTMLSLEVDFLPLKDNERFQTAVMNLSNGNR